MKEKKEKKIKVVKDKEGVVFVVVADPKITKKDRKLESVKYAKSVIEDKLKSNSVYPQNNQVGFRGDIDSVSYFMASIIESFVSHHFKEKYFEIN